MRQALGCVGGGIDISMRTQGSKYKFQLSALHTNILGKYFDTHPLPSCG